MPTELNDCGCCEGITAVVPLRLTNRPGLSAVGYRIGRHADFLESALATLSDPKFPALRDLTTRASDDFTIALLDGWATLADVFTFYQEQIANEFWLRTATERDSILRLAQLIGYRLKPGVAAETPLAFLLDETPGAPTQVTVAIGTKVQSVPGPDEKAQTFETVEEIEARVEWNALRPTLTTPAVVGAKSLYLEGTATNLQAGDAIVIIGSTRDFRILLSVTTDLKNDRTRITWETSLGTPPAGSGAASVKVYAMRQRAALYGHNAPNPALIFDPSSGGAIGSWENFEIGTTIDLDNVYSKVVPHSWVALTKNGTTSIYRANSVSFPSRDDFALSGKVTRIAPDTQTGLSAFGLRETVVHGQSELLAMTSGPLLEPVAGGLAAALTRDPDLLAPIEGSVIGLDRLIPPLEAGNKVVLIGKLLRARVASLALSLKSFDGSETRSLVVGQSLLLTARPTLLPLGFATFTLRTDDGFEGTITTWAPAAFVLMPARPDDPTLSELALIKECTGNPSTLTLESPLAQIYDRASVTISANVADATHGETVTEVLGSGDASQPNQSFKLKQTPALTYTRSTAPGGAESTLQIRVNDLLWHEMPTLFKRAPREHVYITELADDGTVTVRFGDGAHGARLPSGAENKATYRRGIGLDGLVRAGQLTTLLTRPPGLKSALNPLPAEGADEPESFANAQQNAPLTVMTLERVVSLEDYENFSRAYAGIAKALATWTWDGRTRGVFLTVAGPLGAAVSSTLADDLITSIHDAGDPFVPVRVASYDEVHFKLAGKIKVDPDYEEEKVLTAATEALREEFSFANRTFGQPVVASEVIALIQGVAGVVAVDLDTLYRTGQTVKWNSRLEADLPNGGHPASLGAAELLTLDPAPIELEVMP